MLLANLYKVESLDPSMLIVVEFNPTPIIHPFCLHGLHFQI